MKGSWVLARTRTGHGPVRTSLFESLAGRASVDLTGGRGEPNQLDWGPGGLWSTHYLHDFTRSTVVSKWMQDQIDFDLGFTWDLHVCVSVCVSILLAQGVFRFVGSKRTKTTNNCKAAT